MEIIKNHLELGKQSVAQNCLNRATDLFHALSRLNGLHEMKETNFETRTSEQAKQDTKLVNRNKSEFFERLDFGC